MTHPDGTLELLSQRQHSAIAYRAFPNQLRPKTPEKWHFESESLITSSFPQRVELAEPTLDYVQGQARGMLYDHYGYSH